MEFNFLKGKEWVFHTIRRVRIFGYLSCVASTYLAVLPKRLEIIVS